MYLINVGLFVRRSVKSYTVYVCSFFIKIKIFYATLYLFMYLHAYILFVGKGPLREYYEEMIKTKNLTRVKICTLWLSSEDYSLLVGNNKKVIKMKFVIEHTTV